MTHLVTFDLQAADPEASALTEFLSEILPGTRDYNGCQSADVTPLGATPGQVLLVERWDSKQSFESYLNWRVDRGDFGKLRKQLSTDPTITHFQKT